MILAIDPGTKLSAYALYDHTTGHLMDKGKIPNLELRSMLSRIARDANIHGFDVLAIEGMRSYGAGVGSEVFDTLIWIGRFLEAARPKIVWPVFRQQVRMHFGAMRGNKSSDAVIRDAMCRRHGGDAKLKYQKGHLAGVTKDVWSALAIATFVGDSLDKGITPPKGDDVLAMIAGFATSRKTGILRL